MISTRRTKVKSVGVLSVALTQAALMMFLSFLVMLVYGVFFGIMMLALGGASSSGSGSSPFGPQEGIVGVVMIVVMIIGVPILYGVMGFIFGAIGAALYNMVSRWTGGIELELAEY